MLQLWSILKERDIISQNVTWRPHSPCFLQCAMTSWRRPNITAATVKTLLLCKSQSWPAPVALQWRFNEKNSIYSLLLFDDIFTWMWHINWPYFQRMVLTIGVCSVLVGEQFSPSGITPKSILRWPSSFPAKTSGLKRKVLGPHYRCGIEFLSATPFPVCYHFVFFSRHVMKWGWALCLLSIYLFLHSIEVSTVRSLSRMAYHSAVQIWTHFIIR